MSDDRTDIHSELNALRSQYENGLIDPTAYLCNIIDSCKLVLTEIQQDKLLELESCMGAVKRVELNIKQIDKVLGND